MKSEFQVRFLRPQARPDRSWRAQKFRKKNKNKNNPAHKRIFLSKSQVDHLLRICYNFPSMTRGLAKKLTEKQMKFSRALVFNETRLTPRECAIEAGYDPDSSHVRASELRNPKLYPLVVKYIGELREEVQKTYGVTFEKHLMELAKLRDESRGKGAWSAAINAEIARGKAAGLYVDQKLVMTGNLDQMSEEELQEKMKQILEDHKNIINITAEENPSGD